MFVFLHLKNFLICVIIANILIVVIFFYDVAFWVTTRKKLFKQFTHINAYTILVFNSTDCYLLDTFSTGQYMNLLLYSSVKLSS